jgi:RimJ/RimL family protein N-acetyltransferase
LTPHPCPEQVDRHGIRIRHPHAFEINVIPAPDHSQLTPASLHSQRLDVRLLAPGDETALQEVFGAAGDYFLSITGRTTPDPDAAEREIRACAAAAGRDVALVSLRDTEEPVGVLGWWRGNPEPDVALLGTMLVVPAHRQKGIAREALGLLEEWLILQGVRRVRTGVAAGDQRTHVLLRRLGFEAMDQRTHVSLDRGRMMIALFEKEIRQPVP